MTNPTAAVPHVAGRSRASGVLFAVLSPLIVAVALLRPLLGLLALAGRPGTLVNRRAEATAPGLPTDTGRGFFIGITDRGPVEPVLVRSGGQAVRRFGDSVGGAGALLRDSYDLWFGEGGADLVISRVVGPAAAPSSVTLADSLGVDTLRIDGVDVGEYGNDLAVTILDGDEPGTFTVVVLDGGQEVERHADLDSPTAAVATIADSSHVRAVDLASGSADPNPAPVTAAALTGGTDDREGVTDDDWQAATDRIDASFGVGQVMQPGRTSGTAHAQIEAHARERNRTAYLDAPNRAGVATLKAAAAGLNSQHGGIFATWKIIPARVGNILREVPGSVYAAAVTARNDALADPSVWPIAEQGRARYALGITRAFSDDERTELTEAGVNVSISDGRGVRLYGFRSVSKQPEWFNLGHQRLAMAIQAEAENLQERYVGRRVDNATIGDYAADVEALLAGFYAAGALDGDGPDGTRAPEFAYVVDVGPDFNDETTRANRELAAGIYARFAESAELVFLGIVKVPTAARLAA